MNELEDQWGYVVGSSNFSRQLLWTSYPPSPPPVELELVIFKNKQRGWGERGGKFTADHRTYIPLHTSTFWDSEMGKRGDY
jgi:hypothetical protein